MPSRPNCKASQKNRPDAASCVAETRVWTGATLTRPAMSMRRVSAARRQAGLAATPAGASAWKTAQATTADSPRAGKAMTRKGIGKSASRVIVTTVSAIARTTATAAANAKGTWPTPPYQKGTIASSRRNVLWRNAPNGRSIARGGRWRSTSARRLISFARWRFARNDRRFVRAFEVRVPRLFPCTRRSD